MTLTSVWAQSIMESLSAKQYSRRQFHRLIVAGAVGMNVVQAQDENAPEELSSEAIAQYGRMYRMMQDIDGFLRAIQFENSAIIGPNFFSISVGGIDAIHDLEDGRGVDPETLAGLYAGFAIPEVSKHLNVDFLPGGGTKILAADGRLRYKGTVVRLYSPAHLRGLFATRRLFQNENDRIKRQAFSTYVTSRKRDVGQLDRAGQDNESRELVDKFEKLRPLLVELDGKLQGERRITSILQGDTTQHMFGMSIAGIDVAEDLRTRHSVDPETMAAIYAQNVSTDYAASFQVGINGSIQYDGTPISMYSQKRLEACFKLRERLAVFALNR